VSIDWTKISGSDPTYLVRASFVPEMRVLALADERPQASDERLLIRTLSGDVKARVTVEAAYEASQIPAHQLRYALALMLAGHERDDPPYGRAALRLMGEAMRPVFETWQKGTFQRERDLGPERQMTLGYATFILHRGWQRDPFKYAQGWLDDADETVRYGAIVAIANASVDPSDASKMGGYDYRKRWSEHDKKAHKWILGNLAFPVDPATLASKRAGLKQDVDREKAIAASKWAQIDSEFDRRGIAIIDEATAGIIERAEARRRSLELEAWMLQTSGRVYKVAYPERDKDEPPPVNVFQRRVTVAGVAYEIKYGLQSDDFMRAGKRTEAAKMSNQAAKFGIRLRNVVSYDQEPPEALAVFIREGIEQYKTWRRWIISEPQLFKGMHEQASLRIVAFVYVADLLLTAENRWDYERAERMIQTLRTGFSPVDFNPDILGRIEEALAQVRAGNPYPLPDMSAAVPLGSPSTVNP